MSAGHNCFLASKEGQDVQMSKKFGTCTGEHDGEGSDQVPG